MNTKTLLFAVLIAASGAAVAAQSVTMPVLSTGRSVSITDDGKSTYIDLGKKAVDYPAVFERMPMGNKVLRNFVLASDGRMRMEGVLARGELQFPSEKFEFDRR